MRLRSANGATELPPYTSRTASHFQVLERIGSGGMGEVYLALDTRLDRNVALKFLPVELSRNELARQRFVQEAKAASALNHPNVCTVHEVGETSDGQTFIAMAHYDGQTLKQKLEGGPLPIDEAIVIASDVAKGLAVAHGKGIIHRDIKPSNIMLTSDGRSVILDFGLAKLTGAIDLTKTGSTVGTAHYMSPEQIRAEPVDHRTDIWSLGVILYEMLAARRPFDGAYEQQLAYRILNEDAESLRSIRSEVPENLEEVVVRLLAKDPEVRYQQAEDLVRDVAAYKSVSMEEGTKVGTEDRSTSRRRFRRTRMGTAVGAALALAVVFLVFRPAPFSGTGGSSPKPIVVMPFENQTGEDDYDYLKKVIPTLLITNLERSRHLTPLTWERMTDLLNAMGKSATAVVDMDSETGFELCRRDQVVAIVLGSFTRAGEVFALDAKILDVTTKELLIGATASGEGVGSILQHQIDEISTAVSGALDIPEHNFTEEAGIAEVTTTSLDAYRRYVQARADYERFDFVSAKALTEQATAIDSTFASAYYVLARANRTLGNLEAGDRALERANDLAVSATEKERLYIKSYYALVAERDAEKALMLTEELARKYPAEKEAIRLVGEGYRRIGRLEEAVEAYTRALELDPAWAAVYNAIGYALARLGRYREATENMSQYAALAGPGPNPLDSMGEVLLISGDLDEAIQVLRRATSSYPDWYGVSDITLAYAFALKEEYGPALARFAKLDELFRRRFSAEEHASLLVFTHREHGRLLVYLGRHRQAMELFRKQADMARLAGSPLGEAQAHELTALSYAALRQFDVARTELQKAYDTRLSYATDNRQMWDRSYHSLAGLLDVRDGRIASAKEHRDRAARILREVGDEIFSYWVTLLDGEILLAEGQPQQAIERLRTADAPNPYFVSWWSRPNYALPIARDGLARAYEAAGDMDRALAEYHRLTRFDGRSRDRYLIDPMYHYRLARLAEGMGRHELARQEYERFIEIWKGADEALQTLVKEAQLSLRRLAEERDTKRYN